MTKKVAFLLRDDAIPFYYEVAKGLNKIGIEVFWVTINKSWYHYLKKRVPEKFICFIPTFFKSSTTPVDSSKVVQLEKQFPEFTLAKWILSDRGLVGRKYRECQDMLARFTDDFSRFLDESQVDCVLGEMTFSIELIAYYLCQSKKVNYLYPDSVKIPSDRFAFFETPYYGSEFMRRPYDLSHVEQARKYYQHWLQKKVKPHSYILHRHKPLPTLAWIKKFFQWTGESDYISSDTFQVAKKKIREFVNYLYLKTVPFCKVKDLPQDRRYVIYPLHKQPEASVDVTAPEFSNQLATIENIARSLPYNYYLLVKEHSHALGCRGRDFYQQLRKIKNVILIDPYENGYAVLERCDFVTTIASTMGYEAALLGKSVLTFSKVFYGSLPNVMYCPQMDQMGAKIKECILAIHNNDSHEEMIKFLARLFANSYVGIKGNPRVHVSMMEADHIQGWVSAFKDFLSQQDVNLLSNHK